MHFLQSVREQNPRTISVTSLPYNRVLKRLSLAKMKLVMKCQDRYQLVAKHCLPGNSPELPQLNKTFTMALSSGHTTAGMLDCRG